VPAKKKAIGVAVALAVVGVLIGSIMRFVPEKDQEGVVNLIAALGVIIPLLIAG
jgi:uncharacterized membrane protein YdjX (TVP38/TMEM64 family)